MPITSSLTSNLGQSSTTSTTLQATGCNELAFKPSFKASTSAHTSHLNGASLTVKLSMPVKLGTESNIREVKVSLPEQLPARLPTLQQACTEAQFDSNPAGCPKGSFVGSGSASTPILPVPLTGPAIFVSHGGEEFPSLVLLLQGYGVTVDLVGSTFVNGKTGVISTTFRAVPDEPVGSFTLTLPEGPYSAVAANANLCKITRTIHAKRRLTVRSHGRKRLVTHRVSEHVKASLADADGLHRPERPDDPPQHTDRRHRLPHGEDQAQAPARPQAHPSRASRQVGTSAGSAPADTGQICAARS